MPNLPILSLLFLSNLLRSYLKYDLPKQTYSFHYTQNLIFLNRNDIDFFERQTKRFGQMYPKYCKKVCFPNGRCYKQLFSLVRIWTESLPIHNNEIQEVLLLLVLLNSQNHIRMTHSFTTLPDLMSL